MVDKDDWTYPETVVGKDYNIGEVISAGCYGKVWRVYHNLLHHSIMVLVSLSNVG
jgi:hypothetical protein